MSATTMTAQDHQVDVPGALPRGRGISRVAWPFAQLILFAALMLSWQWLTSRAYLNPFFYGEPSKIWDYLHEWFRTGSIWHNAWTTIFAALVGWVLGTFIGTAIGVTLGVLPTVRAIVSPFLAFLNGTPRIIFYPFFAVWLGYTLTSKVLLVIFVIVVVVVFNVQAGMRELPRELVEHVRAIGGNQRHLLRNVYVPSLTLWILSSSRLTAGFALQAAIVSEFVGPQSGLGYLAVLGQGRFDINLTFAAIVVMVVVGLILDSLLVLLERGISRWKE